MKTFTLIIFVLVHAVAVTAQTTIKGIVADKNGQPLAGANIFIKGTYDGTSSAADGSYLFSTPLTGELVLVATFIGYQAAEVEVTPDGGRITQNFSLGDASISMGGVTISAGLFETSDRAQNLTLQPLDIVTTPSAAGDLFGALSTLPGTATVGEDGRLFVRGGDAYETKTFIDGLLVKKPYGSNVPDLPSRGRFSPFLFSGTTFSTGGYSAEYGQALSSALILNTNAFPEKTQTEMSLMSIGGGVTQTMKHDSYSVALGVEYMNLRPYFQLVPNAFEMNYFPESVGSTLSIRSRLTDEGVLKVFSTFQASRMGLKYPDLEHQGRFSDISILNQNSYTNLNYIDNLGGDWILRAGFAFSFDNNDLDMETFRVDEQNRNAQAKMTLKKDLTQRMNILFGAEQVFNRFEQHYREADTHFQYKSSFDDFLTALFAESEFRPFARWAVRLGLRGEHSSVLGAQNLAARLSAAYKFSQTSQMSFAYGNFFQTPEEQLLRFTNSLKFEQADHYILNYQWAQNNRLLRLEGYVKDYKSLVTYNGNQFWNGSLYANSGFGHARGVDVFWRDRQSFSALEYWLSYSFVDSRRKYRDFPHKATPHFAPRHTASLVAKKWMQSISTQLGLSATMASGRTYHDPNSSKFMNEKTPFYNDISINASYLTRIFDCFTIVHLSVNNILGRENIFGYRYYNQPDANGVYEALPIKADARRFYFVGVFVTI